MPVFVMFNVRLLTMQLIKTGRLNFNMTMVLWEMMKQFRFRQKIIQLKKSIDQGSMNFTFLVMIFLGAIL